MCMYPSYTSIYHAIPSYDGISRYMSGYQGVRIPDAVTQTVPSHGDGRAGCPCCDRASDGARPSGLPRFTVRAVMSLCDSISKP